MTGHDTSDLLERLEALSPEKFVELIRRALARRSSDLEQHHFESRYALAVVSASRARVGFSEQWEVEFVATPSAEDWSGNPLLEQGTCEVCGTEAICEAKSASCAICGSTVALT